MNDQGNMTATTDGSPHALSLLEAEVQCKPFEYWARARKDDPVHFDERLGAYVITRFDHVQECLKAVDVFSMELGFSENHRGDFDDELAALYEAAGLEMRVFGPFGLGISVDPPKHAARRALLKQAFTASRVAKMEEYLRDMAHSLIDGFIDDGRAEFMSQFAIPLPVNVIGDQLGCARDNLQKFRAWSDAAVGTLGRADDRATALRQTEKMIEFYRFLQEEIEKRRSNRADDLISDLVYAEFDEGRLPDEILISLCMNLVVAGNETTSNALGSALMILATDHSQAAKLLTAQDRDMAMARFCEEVLRLFPPVTHVPRQAKADYKVGGVTIKAGSAVYLAYGSGNRDETRFDDADQFDASRRCPHMSFGGGIHNCVGQMLARMEMKSALSVVLDRIEDLRLEMPAEDLPIAATAVNRGHVELPIAFRKK